MAEVQAQESNEGQLSNFRDHADLKEMQSLEHDDKSEPGAVERE